MLNPTRRLTIAPFAFFALALCACSGPLTVKMAEGIEFEGLTIPREASPGQVMDLDLTFKTSHPLQGNWQIFLHIESAASENCRIVFDRPPTVPIASWNGQTIHHKVQVPVPTGCKPGRLDVFTGIFETKSFTRLKVISPPSSDDRLAAGWVDIVSADADGRANEISPRRMARRGTWNAVRPWRGWLAGVMLTSAIGAALASALRRKRAESTGNAGKTFGDEMPLWMRWAPWVIYTVPLVLSILVVLEFIKDDAYISFRYAHNLIHGNGLTFNPGERLEGFTNFLWTLLMAPFEGLGWDLFQVCEFLGTGISLVVLWMITRYSTWINGARRNLSHVWGALWVATSSSWVLWAKSGLEQPLAAMLPLLSTYLLWRAQDAGRLEDGSAMAGAAKSKAGAWPRSQKLGAWSGVVMALGCMTRPEMHLMALLVGFPLLIEAIRFRKLPRVSVLYAATIVAITVPFHAFRYFYFGSLVPNTFYVKTGSGPVWREGLRQLFQMFSFNNIGVLVLFVPFAFLPPRDQQVNRRLYDSPPERRAPRAVWTERKLVLLAISLAFMAYIVKVGVDEMQWFRLYLPAMPFLLILVTVGAQNLCDALFAVSGKRLVQWGSYGLLWAGFGVLCALNFGFTCKEFSGFNGHGDLAGTFHPDMGKFIVRHERPGGLVAFQDVGSTPYHAPDIDFLDFIGLVDGTVARARHSYGLHAFVSTQGNANMAIYDAQMREYFWQRNPEWAILTVYPPPDQESIIAERFDRDPGPGAIGDAYNNNSYQFEIWKDPRFHQRYVHVRTWQRSRGYYLSLFRRKDLWDQTPGEVVLDAPPAEMGGVTASFEGGLELLGAQVTPTDPIERHEVFITTWWRVPGPMPEDTLFFLHVNNASGDKPFQAPLDHPPGDWMYPANRWKPGQIIEDRVLFQLPVGMKVGDYDVNIGVYRRSTGERLKIINPPTLPDGSIKVGSFLSRRFWPVFHQLIPPTDLAVMRKYPDRIVKAR